MKHQILPCIHSRDILGFNYSVNMVPRSQTSPVCLCVGGSIPAEQGASPDQGKAVAPVPQGERGGWCPRGGREANTPQRLKEMSWGGGGG